MFVINNVWLRLSVARFFVRLQCSCNVVSFLVLCVCLWIMDVLEKGPSKSKIVGSLLAGKPCDNGVRLYFLFDWVLRNKQPRLRSSSEYIPHYRVSS